MNYITQSSSDEEDYITIVLFSHEYGLRTQVRISLSVNLVQVEFSPHQRFTLPTEFYQLREELKNDAEFVARVCLYLLHLTPCYHLFLFVPFAHYLISEKKPISSFVKLYLKIFFKIELFARSFLYDYLSPCCKNVARRRYYGIGQIPSLQRRYQLNDYEQMCWQKLGNIALFLGNFAWDSPFPLKAYTSQALFYSIRDTIYRQNPEIRRLRYSGYRLLYDGREEEMKQALSIHYYDKKIVEIAYQIWSCFKEIIAPENGQFQDPTADDFSDITDLFNRRKSPEIPPKTSQEIQTILQECITALTNWRRREEVYPDSQYPQDTTAQNQWEYLESKYYLGNNYDPYSNMGNPITICLNLAFDYVPRDKKRRLKPSEKSLLEADSCFNLNLTDLGKLIGRNQSTVSRNRQKAMRKLVTNFLEIWENRFPELSQESNLNFREEDKLLLISALIPQHNQNYDDQTQSRMKIIKYYFEECFCLVCFHRLDQLTVDIVRQKSELEHNVIQARCEQRIEDYFVHNLPIRMLNNNIELLREKINKFVETNYR